MKGRAGVEEELVTCFPLLPSRPNTAVRLALLPPFSSPPSPSLPSSPLHSFFFCFSSSFLRGKWEEEAKGGRTPGLLEICPIPALKRAPQLLWLETGLVSASLFLPRPSPPGTQFFCSSSPLRLCSAAFLPGGAASRRQPAEFNQEDNVHESSLQSIYISHSVFLSQLLAPIKWSTASSAKGKCDIFAKFIVSFL